MELLLSIVRLSLFTEDLIILTEQNLGYKLLVVMHSSPKLSQPIYSFMVSLLHPDSHIRHSLEELIQQYLPATVVATVQKEQLG